MRLALLFTESAIWAIAAAFYPFQPSLLKGHEAEPAKADELTSNIAGSDDSGLTLAIEQRSRKVSTTSFGHGSREATLTSKFGSPRTIKAKANGILSKRLNKYHVMEAGAPSDPMAVGVDQDGTDSAYFIKVQLGSKSKHIYMLIDTGASSSWVMGSEFAQEACSLHNTFGPGDSDTFQAIDKDFNVSYGSGVVQGKMAKDNITVTGSSFEYTFGLASTTSTEFTNFPFDGIPDLSMTHGVNDNFLDKIGETHMLRDNIFAIVLSHINYTLLGSTDGEWAIPIDNISFDGKNAQVGGILAYIDTGTSFIFGPMDKVGKLHNTIPGANSSYGWTFKVPCNTEKPLIFTFSGVDYKVGAKDWIGPKSREQECTSKIYGFEVAKGSWLIGDVFLMNVYSVFDKDKRRIGFSKAAQADLEPPNSTKPAEATSTKLSASETQLLPSSVLQPSDQRSEVPTKGVGGHEASSGRESAQPRETSKSAATGVRFRRKSRLAAAILVVASLACVA